MMDQEAKDELLEYAEALHQTVVTAEPANPGQAMAAAEAAVELRDLAYGPVDDVKAAEAVPVA